MAVNMLFKIQITCNICLCVCESVNINVYHCVLFFSEEILQCLQTWTEEGRLHVITARPGNAFAPADCLVSHDYRWNFSFVFI